MRLSRHRLSKLFASGTEHVGTINIWPQFKCHSLRVPRDFIIVIGLVIEVRLSRNRRLKIIRAGRAMTKLREHLQDNFVCCLLHLYVL